MGNPPDTNIQHDDDGDDDKVEDDRHYYDGDRDETHDEEETSDRDISATEENRVSTRMRRRIW